MQAVFGGFDGVAMFNIISMVSPVFLHAASSQTHSEKLTDHTHKPQGGRERGKEGERKIAQRSIDVHLELTVDVISILLFSILLQQVKEAAGWIRAFPLDGKLIFFLILRCSHLF